jgi:uncharacterized C2H2 Zn-finger protein
MPIERKCPRCNKIFTRKDVYDYHVNKRKRPCDEIIVVKGKTKRTKKKMMCCKFCSNMFINESALNRHIRYNCKITKSREFKEVIKPILDELNYMKKNYDSFERKQRRMKIQINEKDDVILKMKTDLEKLRHKPQTQNRIEKFQNNVFVGDVLPYGKESLKHIKKKEWANIINRAFNSLPVLVQKVHYDPKETKNHNIYISNLKSNVVILYNGHEWIARDRDEILTDMITNRTDDLEKQFEKLLPTLPDHIIKKFKRFLNNVDERKEVNRIKKKLKLILYNKKNLPMKMRQDMLSKKTEKKKLGKSKDKIGGKIKKKDKK